MRKNQEVQDVSKIKYYVNEKEISRSRYLNDMEEIESRAVGTDVKCMQKSDGTPF